MFSWACGGGEGWGERGTGDGGRVGGVGGTCLFKNFAGFWAELPVGGAVDAVTAGASFRAGSDGGERTRA